MDQGPLCGPLWTLSGPLWGPLWTSLDPLWTSLGASVFGSSVYLFGSSVDIFGPSVDIFGPSVDPLRIRNAGILSNIDFGGLRKRGRASRCGLSWCPWASGCSHVIVILVVTIVLKPIPIAVGWFKLV